MVSMEMYELGAKSSVIREIFEFGKKRAVEIGRDFSGSASGSFINGVLNRIMRELPPPEKRKE